MSSPKPALDDLRIARHERPESRPGFRVAGFLLVGVVLVAAAIGWFGRSRAVAVKTVLAREVVRGGMERTVLNASGYVTARREATVSSKITGKVSEVLIEEGMKVREGQVLARLDDTNVRSSLLLAEAQLLSASNALAETRVHIREADQEFKRQAGLLESHIASQSDYDHAEETALSLKAHLIQQESDVVVAQRTVATWQQQLEDTVIRAPFAGVVTSKNAQPGEMISPMSAGGFTRTGICTVVDMDSLEIEIDVNESYINRVEPEQPVEATLDAYPDWKIPCKVIAIIPTADREKSTVKVRVGFDKLDPRILPDMAVKVAFHEVANQSGRDRSVVAVPKAAVHQQDGRDIVMVVQNDRAERRAVSVSNVGADEALISAGLSSGEKVVVEWPEGLTDGAAVREVKP